MKAHDELPKARVGDEESPIFNLAQEVREGQLSIEHFVT